MGDAQQGGFGQGLLNFLNRPEIMAMGQGLLSASRDQYGRPQRMGPALGAGFKSMMNAQDLERQRKLQEDYFGLAKDKFGLQEKQLGMQQQKYQQALAQQEALKNYLGGALSREGGGFLGGGLLSEAQRQNLGLLAQADPQEALKQLSQLSKEPEIAKLARTVYPDDPEAQKNFIIQNKTKPLVSIGDKARSDIDKKRFESLYEDTAKNIEIRSNINEMKSILDFLDAKGVETGYGTGKLLLGRQLEGKMVGRFADPEITSALEKYQALSKHLFVDQLKGISAKGQNVFAEKKVMDAIPELEKSIAGNRQIIDLMEHEINRSDAKVDFFEDYYDQHGSSSKFDRAWREKVKTDPALAKPDVSDIIDQVKSSKKIWIRDNETGEERQVTIEEAKKMGAL